MVIFNSYVKFQLNSSITTSIFPFTSWHNWLPNCWSSAVDGLERTMWVKCIVGSRALCMISMHLYHMMSCTVSKAYFLHFPMVAVYDAVYSNARVSGFKSFSLTFAESVTVFFCFFNAFFPSTVFKTDASWNDPIFLYMGISSHSRRILNIPARSMWWIIPKAWSRIGSVS